MKLIVSYLSAIEGGKVTLTTVELPREIADEIATNFNTQIGHSFALDLVVTKRLGEIMAPIGGLR